MKSQCFLLLFVFFFFNTTILCLNQEELSNIPEKPMVIVVCSYNNERWVELNLQSIFEQKYENYRVIYINDCSQDKTLARVTQVVDKHDAWDRFTLINNETRQGAMANHYTAVYQCANDEIIIQLDGDDWFYTDLALARVNLEYADPEVWLTYGQFEFWPSHEVGYCRPINELARSNTKLLRKVAGLATHLRTFYAGLFKQIKTADLKYQGKFFPVTCDRAFMTPMLEMASPNHFRFIPDILYCYNNTNPISDHRVAGVLQAKLRDLVFAMPCYEPLKKAPCLN